MLVIVGLTIVVLSAIGVIVYAAFSSFASVERHASVVRNIQRLELAASALSSVQRLVASDGRMSLPAPAVEDGKPVLPAWLSVERRSPWGELYGYCVFAEAEPEVGDTYVAGRQMAVSSVAFPVIGVRDYVVRSDRTTGFRPGLRGIVVSGSPDSPATPDCSQVVFDNGTWRVHGGMVRVVMEQVGGAFGLHASTAISAPTVIYVSNDEEIGSGGTGVSAADPVSLDAALNIWLSGRHAAVVLRLAPSAVEYQVPGRISDLSGPGAASGRTLRLESAEATQPVALRLPSLAMSAGFELADLGVTGSPVLAVRQATLRLSSVSFAGTLRLAGGNAEAKGSSLSGLEAVDGARFVAANTVIGPILLDGAELTLGTGTSLMTTGRSAVVARGSRVTLTSDQVCDDGPLRLQVLAADAAMVPSITLQGSELVIAGRDIAHVRDVSGHSPFALDASSRVIVSPRECAGGQISPKLFEGINAHANACAGGPCGMVGPLRAAAPPYFDKIQNDATCDGSSGSICQVEAVCPNERLASRGECLISQAGGGAITLRRFGYGIGDRFICEMVRPIDAEAVISASAMCQR